MNLVETSIPQNYSVEFETVMGVAVPKTQVPYIFRSIMAATADFLKDRKKKNQKTALKYIDNAGNFIMAAIVSYNKNNDEGQDNWNFYFTFDEEDLKDVANVFDSNDTGFHVKLTDRLYDSYRVRCNEAAYMSPMIAMAMSTISSFLDQNAKPDEEVTLEEEGYFVASVTVEDGEPVKALVPDSEMKILIKDDAATEKAA